MTGGYRVGGERVPVEVRVEGGRMTGTAGGEPVDARVARTGPRDVVVRLGARTLRALVVADGRDLLVSIGGRAFRVAPDDGEPAAAAGAATEPFATSPMTGLVTKVAVAPGEDVAANAVLFVVEAMKMEYVVRATAAGSVAEVRRRAGERVSQGEVVVAFRRDGAAGSGA